MYSFLVESWLSPLFRFSIFHITPKAEFTTLISLSFRCRPFLICFLLNTNILGALRKWANYVALVEKANGWPWVESLYHSRLVVPQASNPSKHENQSHEGCVSIFLWAAKTLVRVVCVCVFSRPNKREKRGRKSFGFMLSQGFSRVKGCFFYTCAM